MLADRQRIARESGARAVSMAAEGLTPDRILTPAAFTNALTVLLAVGGSTNAVIHLAAVAGRCGYDLDLDRLDRLSRETPVLVDLKPSGQHYMEDLNKAGGLMPILRALADRLDLDCVTVTGRTLGDEIAAAPAPWPQDVVRERDNPIYPEGGIAVLRGNLAPDGAIIKQSAATPALCRHTGRAVVFDSLADLTARIDDPALDVVPDDVLVLRNAGPKGAPGMPEAGYIPIPRKLATQGVTDMVRLSDARMSGTAFGTIVLHACPEAAIGGPLALVEKRRSNHAGCGGPHAHAGCAGGGAGDTPCRVAPSAAARRCRTRLSRAAPGSRRAGQPRLRSGFSFRPAYWAGGAGLTRTMVRCTARGGRVRVAPCDARTRRPQPTPWPALIPSNPTYPA